MTFKDPTLEFQEMFEEFTEKRWERKAWITVYESWKHLRAMDMRGTLVAPCAHVRESNGGINESYIVLLTFLTQRRSLVVWRHPQRDMYKNSNQHVNLKWSGRGENSKIACPSAKLFLMPPKHALFTTMLGYPVKPVLSKQPPPPLAHYV